MNEDIVYEILRYLYLEGHAPTAKKILISHYNELNIRAQKLEKPVVFEILGNKTVLLLDAGEDTVIYWGGNTISESLKFVCRTAKYYDISKIY